MTNAYAFFPHGDSRHYWYIIPSQSAECGWRLSPIVRRSYGQLGVAAIAGYKSQLLSPITDCGYRQLRVTYIVNCESRLVNWKSWLLSIASCGWQVAAIANHMLHVCVGRHLVWMGVECPCPTVRKVSLNNTTIQRRLGMGAHSHLKYVI